MHNMLVYYSPSHSWSVSISEAAELDVGGGLQNHSLKAGTHIRELWPLGWILIPAPQHHLVAEEGRG